MNFNTFWKKLKNGGTTKKLNHYSVNSSDQLLIKSPGNSNKDFRINKSKVEEYFICLKNKQTTAGDFIKKRSAYFFDVYQSLVTGSVPNTMVNKIPAFLDSDSAAKKLAIEIIGMFEGLDFQIPRRKLPKIIIADDPPNESRCFEDFPESIDGCLGLYNDSQQSITLFCNPIAKTAHSCGVSFSVALAVVLAHELAHWVTYRFDHPKSKCNKKAFIKYGLGQSDFEGKAVTEVVEGIAELATFSAIGRIKEHDLRERMYLYFKKTHSQLSSDYRAFDIYFEFWPLEHVVSHLVRLARQNDLSASTLKDNGNPHWGLNSFEYHWYGRFECLYLKVSPWTLSNSAEPAVKISNSYPIVGCINQIKHEDGGWYNWPSSAISNIPVYNYHHDRPSNLRLRQIYVEFGKIKVLKEGDVAMYYNDIDARNWRPSVWEPDSQGGLRKNYKW